MQLTILFCQQLKGFRKKYNENNNNNLIIITEKEEINDLT